MDDFYIWGAAITKRMARPECCLKNGSVNVDEAAIDAIIPGIANDEKALTAAGIDYGPWPDWLAQGDMVKAAFERPLPVPEALERANSLRAL